MNLCPPQIGSIADKGSMIDYVDYTIELDYDCPNQRIRLKVSFPRGGCYHATVSLAGLQLHNGDFDIIVLESTYKCLTRTCPSPLDNYLRRCGGSNEIPCVFRTS